MCGLVRVVSVSVGVEPENQASRSLVAYGE
jgi:hypothetical protein